MLAFVALFLVVIVGAGAAYWAVKKYRAKQRQEYRFEGTMGQAKAGLDKAVFKEAMLPDVVLEKVIEEHQLVGVWKLDGVDAAKQRIREKFSVKVDELQVKVSFVDRDQVIAEKVLKSIVTAYYAKVKRPALKGAATKTPTP